MKMAKKKIMHNEPVRSRVATPLEGEKPCSSQVHVSKGIFLGLAIVSIIGFIEIIASSLFDVSLTLYVEALLMAIIGIALLLEARVRKLGTLSSGFNSSNFTRLITVIIGVVALIAGIFSFPGIRIESAAFLAIKGILALIAIIVIAIATWVVE